jgi:hypothetical protein
MFFKPLITSATFLVAVFISAEALALKSAQPSLDGSAIPFKTWHTTRLPNEALNLSLPEGYTASLSGEIVGPNTRVQNKAGTQTLIIQDVYGHTQYEIAVFTLEPLSKIDKKGWLNGYRIGNYPKDPPRGFIKLENPDARNIDVSPHFKLGQFLCKQQAKAWPKYVLVSEPNLKRLELLRENLVKDGLTEAKTFFVMSGFRTPFYNTAIGSAKFSRHMYGDAADIYIDVKPRDGVMDDINNDGKVTKADANFLYDYAAKLFAQHPDIAPGGIGSYKANAVHGPFVHIDGRGRTARWGR